MTGMGLPTWPGLDRSAELEALRHESRERMAKRRKRLIALINEEVDATENAWMRLHQTNKERHDSHDANQ